MPEDVGRSRTPDSLLRDGFDPLLALSLAGFSFAAYREPTADTRVWREETIEETTRVSFLDRDFLLETCSGIVTVRVVRVDLPDLDRNADVVLTISAPGGKSSTIKGFQSATTRPEIRFPFRRSDRDGRLMVRVQRKRLFRGDELVGVSQARVGGDAIASGSLTCPLRGGSSDGEIELSLAYEDMGSALGEAPPQSPATLDVIEEEGGTPMSVKTKACCFLNNEESDTQVWTYWNRNERELVFAFRGTEQTEWKDLATDMNLVPCSFDVERTSQVSFLPDSANVMIHSGFLSAYDSVKGALFTQLKWLQKGEGEDGCSWRIYITGHSLGGALATLFAYEVAQSAIAAQVVLYTYGSPRVGNKTFVQAFDGLLPPPASWRLSNASDIIPTVPRLLGYAHVSKSVVIRDDGTLEEDGGKDDLIGERHFYDVIPDMATRAWDSGAEKERAELLNQELALLSTLMDGSALQQHMEDFYMENLQKLAEAINRQVP